MMEQIKSHQQNNHKKAVDKKDRKGSGMFQVVDVDESGPRRNTSPFTPNISSRLNSDPRKN